jgi:hypothetical protein
MRYAAAKVLSKNQGTAHRGQRGEAAGGIVAQSSRKVLKMTAR